MAWWCMITIPSGGIQAGAETTAVSPASPPRMLTREIRYHMPEAGEVWLVWGVNGWHRLPETAQPSGTMIGKNGLMNSPMTSQEDAFVTKVTIPSGTALDYCFLLTKKRDAFDITWPLCEGNYGEVATRSGVTEIGSKLSLALVTQELHYHMPDAKEVSMVWGVNGWFPVPESLRPPSTKMADSLMVTSMRKSGQDFIVSLQVPRGLTIDFGFRITKSVTGGNVNIWEGGGNEGFREIVRDGAPIRVKSNAIVLPTGYLPRDEDEGWGPSLTILGALSAPLLLTGLLVTFRRRQMRKRTANPFNSRRRKPGWVIDSVLSITGLCFGVIGAEQALRTSYPHEGFGTAVEVGWFRQMAYSATQLFTTDATMGLRPWLRTGRYTEYGTLQNSYTVIKDPGHTRLLFVGNTVTYKGKLLRALKSLHGEETLEYWNAGVPTFNTLQQIAFYQVYNTRIAPDHVILNIQPDDVGAIPFAFRNQTGELELYRPAVPRKDLDPSLFMNFYLYRYLRGLTISSREKRIRLWQEYYDSLKSFRDRLARDHIRLSVAVLPVLSSKEEWSQSEMDRRKALLSMLAELQIEHYDLAEVFAPGKPWSASLPAAGSEDWEPSSEMARAFAQYMTHQGLFHSKENKP